MFKMNKSSIEILKEGNLNKYQAAAHKRQLVYKAILEDPSITENKQLAEAAGYNMSNWMADEYTKGSAFIQNMLRQGYIEKHRGKDGQDYFYITNKEEVISDSAPKAIIKNEDDYLKVRVAEQKLQEQIEEYEEDHMGPEGQIKEDWTTDDPIDDLGDSEEIKLFSGSIKIHAADSDGVTFTIEFNDKSQEEICDIIKNINTEFLL